MLRVYERSQGSWCYGIRQNEEIDVHVFYADAILVFRLRLEQARCGDIDASAGVLDQDDAKAGLAKIAGREEAADVGRDAAHDDRRQLRGAIEREHARMLGGDGVRLEIALVALPPDRVKAIGVQGPARSRPPACPCTQCGG